MLAPLATPADPESAPLRVIVVDDHPLYREGIVRALASHGPAVPVVLLSAFTDEEPVRARLQAVAALVLAHRGLDKARDRRRPRRRRGRSSPGPVRGDREARRRHPLRSARAARQLGLVR